MENKDKPAYPARIHEPERLDEYKLLGLTKREAFAMAAMKGLLSNPHYLQQLEQNVQDKVIYNQNEMLCRESLDMADELLKQLGE